jgi:hypothetical protein
LNERLAGSTVSYEFFTDIWLLGKQYIHLALHGFICLAAMVIIRLYNEVVEVLHDVFELGLGRNDGL